MAGGGGGEGGNGNKAREKGGRAPCAAATATGLSELLACINHDRLSDFGHIRRIDLGGHADQDTSQRILRAGVEHLLLHWGGIRYPRNIDKGEDAASDRWEGGLP